MIFILSFGDFINRVEQLKTNTQDGTLERVHYLELGYGIKLYYDKYVTVVTNEKVLNSGLWDNMETFKLQFLSDAIKIEGYED